jgi:ribonuclease E
VTTGEDTTAPENRNPAREPREGRGERGEGRRGRGEGRNGRGPRAEGEARGNGEGRQSPLGFADTEPTAAPAGDAPENQAVLTDGSESAPTTPRADDNGEPREKRQRDRYGRDRGPRGERGERGERAERTEPQAESTPAVDIAVGTDAPATPVAAMPVAHTATAVATPATPIAPTASMPKVTSYTLPTQALLDVAQQSGLQWVNSDASKVQAVQAAIAAEPKPVHVPRERPAPVVLDEGPLVLVETKRDLRAMTLPFEQSSAAQ